MEEKEILKLQCTKKNWYLARIYSNLEKVALGLETIKLGFRHLYMNSVYFILGVIASMIVLSLLSSFLSFPDRVNTFLFILIIVALVYGFVWFRRDYAKYKEKIESLLQPPDEEVLTLYMLSDDGLYMNYYNIPQHHHYFIRWEDMKAVRIVNMALEPIYKNGKLQLEEMQERLERAFEEVKSLVPDFDYKPNVSHKDMFSLRIETKQSDIIYLPIPPEWEHEFNIADRLFAFIEKEIKGDFTEEEKRKKGVVERFFDL